MEEIIKSYKGFDENLCCRDFQYEVGKEYEMDGNIEVCFKKGLAKEIDDISVLGYSWSDFGSKLYSDFHTTTPYDRAQSMYAAVSAM